MPPIVSAISAISFDEYDSSSMLVLKYVLMTENCAEILFFLVAITAFSAKFMKMTSRIISGIMPTARIMRATLKRILLKKALLLFKIVTHSPFGVYISGLLGIFFYFFPESSHMNINSTYIAGVFISPDDA